MRTIKIEMFDYEVKLITNVKDLKFACRHFKDEETTINIQKKNYAGLCVSDFDHAYVIVLDNEVSTLAHEMLHVVQNICDDRYIKDRETSAYLLTYLMKKSLLGNKNKIRG